MGRNMACEFCYDRPIVRATGNNGELVPMICPVCGMGAAPGYEVASDSQKIRHRSKAKAKKNEPGTRT
jgi:hypothetical protein